MSEPIERWTGAAGIVLDHETGKVMSADEAAALALNQIARLKEALQPHRPDVNPDEVQ